VKRILFDTNAYAAFKRGDPGATEVIRLADRIGMNAVVLGELLAGFAGGSHEERNRRELAEFLGSPRVEMLPLSSSTAEHYAGVFQLLRRKGRPIPTNDLWIAASALEHGYAVYTHDEHFRAIEGLVTGKTPAAFLP
jgi:tRNA(fMet)-specific endonuclease VapC